MHPGERLSDAFEVRPNALNAIRLALAATVIVWHASALTGHAAELPAPVRQLLAELPVDGFFAISGFLICRAWIRRPVLRVYLLARGRRILPGLWVCLLVVAFVIAPLMSTTQIGEQVRFVLGNGLTWHGVRDIAGGPAGVPFPHEWNGSLWSLGYEAGCYLAVAALGVFALLRPQVILGLAATFWALSVSMVLLGLPSMFGWLRVPRIGLMFACGALLWGYRDRVVLDRRLAAAAVALIGIGGFLPDYRVIAAPALAYLMLWLSLTLGKHPRLVLTDDLSYGTYVYAFPIQQALLMVGVTTAWLPFAGISFAATLPVAGLSWWLVERPAMRWRPSPRVATTVVGGSLA